MWLEDSCSNCHCNGGSQMLSWSSESGLKFRITDVTIWCEYLVFIQWMMCWEPVQRTDPWTPPSHWVWRWLNLHFMGSYCHGSQTKCYGEKPPIHTVGWFSLHSPIQDSTEEHVWRSCLGGIWNVTFSSYVWVVYSYSCPKAKWFGSYDCRGPKIQVVRSSSWKALQVGDWDRSRKMNAFERLIVGRSQGFLGQTCWFGCGEAPLGCENHHPSLEESLQEMLLEAFQPQKIWLIVDLLSVKTSERRSSSVGSR